MVCEEQPLIHEVYKWKYCYHLRPIQMIRARDLVFLSVFFLFPHPSKCNSWNLHPVINFLVGKKRIMSVSFVLSLSQKLRKEMGWPTVPVCTWCSTSMFHLQLTHVVPKGRTVMYLVGNRGAASKQSYGGRTWRLCGGAPAFEFTECAINIE